jgi:arginase
MSTPSSDMLHLFFPQWQGAGRFGLYEGAKLLYAPLHPRVTFTPVPTSVVHSLAVDQNILGRHQIFSQLLDACRLIQAHDPKRIFTLGGDCGVEIAPVSFLNRKYDRAIALIWLDAHGDLNTPHSSPSAHFHGMPLRALLGEGDAAIVNQAFSRLHPHQVFLVGARDLDPPEKRFVQRAGLSIFSAGAINTGGHPLLFEALNQGGFDKIYIHLDLDVLDPKAFPHVACPTPDGISINKLEKLLIDLDRNFDVIGASVLEFLPTHPGSLAALEVVKLLEKTNLLRLKTG